MEAVTLGIAIWGALTGTVALLIDRPKVAAHQQIEYDHESAKLVLHVVNNGRRPVTVFQAGFSTEPWGREGPRMRRVARSRIGDASGPETPAPLAPGDVLTYTLDLIRPNYAYMPDEAPQGFAMDTRRGFAAAKPRIRDEDLRRVYDQLTDNLRT